MREHISRKITLAAFFIFIFTLTLIAPSFSRQYDNNHRIVSKLNSVGFLYDLSQNATDESIYDYSESAASFGYIRDVALSITGADFSGSSADYSSCLPYLRSDMTSGFTEDGVFVFPDNMKTSMPESQNFSTAHVYELALRLLGYNSEDFGTNSDSVLAFAAGIKFGFASSLEYSEYVKKGMACAIFYEALFLPVKNSEYSLLRLISETNPGKKDIFTDAGMIDDMPSFLPLYTKSPYVDESFSYFATAATAENNGKSEWSARYSMADTLSYESYCSVLENAGWILDTKYKIKGDADTETCSLYYKTIEGTEHYCLVRFNENLSVINIWTAV